MKNGKDKPTESPRKARRFGRLTDEEYEEMQIGGDKISQSNQKRFHSANLRRLTDEEYENLPYGNSGFYEQFTK